MTDYSIFEPEWQKNKAMPGEHDLMEKQRRQIKELEGKIDQLTKKETFLNWILDHLDCLIWKVDGVFYASTFRDTQTATGKTAKEAITKLYEIWDGEDDRMRKKQTMEEKT